MKKLKNETKNAAALPAAAVVCGLLLLYAPQARQGVSDALTVCGTVILPSLFPLLILSSFAAACPCPRRLQTLCAVPLRRVFGLSPGCLLPLALGLTCGYPLAAKAARTAREQGLITAEDAGKLTLFITCPGVPFAVTVAGSGCFGSSAVGWTLFASCALADLTLACLFRLMEKKTREAVPACPPPPEAVPLSGRLVAAVEQATRAILSVCAWIAGFSALSGVAAAVSGGKAELFFSLFAEVTAALRRTAAMKNPPLAAGCLSFGGLCVFCQLTPDINETKTGAARFLAVRLLSAGFSFAAEHALLRLLPVTVPTETKIGGYRLSANSVAGSAALLFLCAVFMAETACNHTPAPCAFRSRARPCRSSSAVSRTSPSRRWGRPGSSPCTAGRNTGR